MRIVIISVNRVTCALLMTSPNSTNATGAQPPPQAVKVDSRDLMRNAKTLWIAHGTTWYRLQETRSGKLILTK